MTSTPIRLTGQPGIVGIPFRRGLVPNAGDVLLSRPDGRILPAHTTPAAHHPDGSIRVVHLHVPPGTPAGEYVVRVASGVVRPASAPVGPADGLVGILPAAWLCASGLFGPLLPSVAASPLPSSAILKGQLGAMSDVALYDTAQAAFAGTVLNLDPTVTAPDRIQAQTDAEPWLYDRAGALFQLYARTGDEEVLEHAARESAFYRDRLYRLGDTAPDGAKVASRNIGMFLLKVRRGLEWPGANGAMYSYAAPLAYRWWLLGDADARARIGDVIGAHFAGEGFTPEGERVWNERHVGITLMAWCYAYEVAEGSVAAPTLVTKLAQSVTLLGASQADDGAIWHTYDQHAEGEVRPRVSGLDLLASPWMSAVLGLALVRVWHVTGSARAAEVVVGLARMAARSVTLRPAGSTDYRAEHWAPAYLMGRTGPYAEQPTDAEHAIDVAALIAWGAALTTDGAEREKLRTAAARLVATYRMTVDYWTRPNPAAGRADFRVSPPRKWNWMYGAPASWSAALARLSPSVPTPVPPRPPDPDPLDGWRALLPASALGSSVRLAGGVIEVHSTGWKVGAEKVVELDVPAGARVRVSGATTSTATQPVWQVQAWTRTGSLVATGGYKSPGRTGAEIALPGGRIKLALRVLSNDSRAHDYTARDLIVEVVT